MSKKRAPICKKRSEVGGFVNPPTSLRFLQIGPLFWIKLMIYHIFGQPISQQIFKKAKKMSFFTVPKTFLLKVQKHQKSHKIDIFTNKRVLISSY